MTSYDKQGLNGGPNSSILTLRYPAGDRQFRAETVFFKHTINPEEAEAPKYEFLAAQNVPTRRLLGVIQKEGVEVLLLEFLPTIGINFNEFGEVNELLHLAAQLNSCAPPPGMFKPSSLENQAAFDRTVQLALTEMVHDRTLPARVDDRLWFEAYQIAQKAWGFMPQVVTHGEFYFQQVGWADRDTGRHLVIFDLETLYLRPMFTDIADILHPLAVYSGQDEIGLFKVYLERFLQLNRLKMGLKAALRELRLLRITSMCWSLPWLVTDSRIPGATSLREMLEIVTDDLNEDMRVLKLIS